MLKTGIYILAWFAAIAATAGDFIAGADMSGLPFFESHGLSYVDGGQSQDALKLLSAHGLNCVRLRLFTSSAAQAQADPYNSGNNLDYTLALAVRVKNAGLRLMLDFHYSDTWADPGHQAKPAAWTNLAFPQLVQQMHDYNSNCIATFKQAGAMPDYVAVGNEITSGLLWPDGYVGGASDTPAQWSRLGQLVNAAIQGIKDAAGTQTPPLIIHIDRGGDWAGTQWFFDNLRGQQVSFDIIGESYYPFWHGPPGNLRTCLNNAAARYSKPVLVTETDFPWINSTNIYGFPATTNGQMQYVAALAHVVLGVPGGRGMGIVWWGTEYQQVSGFNLAGFEQRSFFDSTGALLPVADAFGALRTPLNLGANWSANGLTLQWPLSGAGCSLASSTNFTPSSVWLPVNSSIQSSGTVFTTTVTPATNGNQFFRLRANY